MACVLRQWAGAKSKPGESGGRGVSDPDDDTVRGGTALGVGRKPYPYTPHVQRALRLRNDTPSISFATAAGTRMRRCCRIEGAMSTIAGVPLVKRASSPD